MMVGMAAGAFVVRHRVGHAARRVAFFAIHRFVFAFQGKMGFVVVKTFQARSAPKRVLRMALGTIGAKSALVDVPVALVAPLVWDAEPVLEHQRRCDVCFVALFAGSLFVFSL